MIGSAELLSLPEQQERQIVDVREPGEFNLGAIPGAVNIPLGELRRRLEELNRDKEVIAYCSVGLRSYLAARILVQHGFKEVRSLDGGYRVYRAMRDELEPKEGEIKTEEEQNQGGTAAASSGGGPAEVVKLDCCGLQCPGPIMQVFNKINELPQGALLEVCATDPGFVTDIQSWCRRTGNTLLRQGHDGRSFTALIRKGDAARPLRQTRHRSRPAGTIKPLWCSAGTWTGR